MKTLLLIFILALAGVSSGSAPVQSASERMMQGTWLLEGGGEKNTPRWYLEWTFDDKGKFSLNGYPPLHQEGSYRIIKSKDNALTLELFDQKGNFGTSKSQMQVVVDGKQDRLTIKDKGPFRRVINKTGNY
ncbi:MAG TPA: hypothetical protein VGC91_12620 [Pyrinomonadaceae bacterium]|jgi:hypothetical protein